MKEPGPVGLGTITNQEHGDAREVPGPRHAHDELRTEKWPMLRIGRRAIISALSQKRGLRTPLNLVMVLPMVRV
jgi:hypothetical protein